MAKCRNWVLFPHRHAASCRFSGKRGCLAFLGSLTCKIEEKKERKIVTHIIDARQVFLFTTIGVRSGESRQTPAAAKPPCVLEVTARVCWKLVGDVKRGVVSHACSFRAAIKHKHALGIGRTRCNPAGADVEVVAEAGDRRRQR
jgi:hypothetical protein